MGSFHRNKAKWTRFHCETAGKSPTLRRTGGAIRGYPMRFRVLLPIALATLASGPVRADDLAFVNRLSWGETAQGDTLNGKSPRAWLEEQLHPGADDGLPQEV